jgi:hypothetical protein
VARRRPTRAPALTIRRACGRRRTRCGRRSRTSWRPRC